MKVWMFFRITDYILPIFMNEHHRSLISLIPLIICLCVGSLLALPAGDYAGGIVLEIFEIDIENGDLFDHAESDDEFCAPFFDAANVDLLLLKSHATNLGFQNLPLSPVTPPPKSA